MFSSLQDTLKHNFLKGITLVFVPLFGLNLEAEKTERKIVTVSVELLYGFNYTCHDTYYSSAV